MGFRDSVTGAEHVALLSPQTPGSHPRVAIHAECVLGDLFGGTQCRCATRLDRAVRTVAETGGVVVYLRRPALTLVPCQANPRSDDEVAIPSLGVADQGAAAAILSHLGYTRVGLFGQAMGADDLAAGGSMAVNTPTSDFIDIVNGLR
jgi:3,4-dihydroxy 2-butanone 4-phosphate synthase/GTP cyclohydrolase II